MYGLSAVAKASLAVATAQHQPLGALLAQRCSYNGSGKVARAEAGCTIYIDVSRCIACNIVVKTCDFHTTLAFLIARGVGVGGFVRLGALHSPCICNIDRMCMGRHVSEPYADRALPAFAARRYCSWEIQPLLNTAPNPAAEDQSLLQKHPPHFQVYSHHALPSIVPSGFA